MITGESLPKVNPEEFWGFQVDLVDGFLKYNKGKCLTKKYSSQVGRSRKKKSSTTKNSSAVDRERTSHDHDRSQGSASNEGVATYTIELSQFQVSSNDSTSTQSNQKQKISPSEIVMINGRAPELTVKFSTRPELPETGKKVTLQVNSDNGISVRATLNRKTLKKQVDKMDSFEEWVGALSGQMSGLGDDGVIELVGAGLQVFEKKSKPKDTDKEEQKTKEESTSKA
ncbi:MAG: hypothetical protein QNJ54_27155 [Prochloraceae cyanobacterium]|nr:hypothetical protein [Prochloraceae cyanobacterium]